MDDLYLFARAFNMAAILLMRWDRDTTWYWAEPSDVPVTESGNYRVNPTVSVEKWRTLDRLRPVMEESVDCL